LLFGLLALSLALAGAAGAQTPATEPSALPTNPLAGSALVEELRKGGYVLYIRHTSTDFGQNDEGMTSFEDCARQRNLTDKGREEARVIGAAIKRLGIPIGTVLASPYCRTVETAMLVFGKAEKSRDVIGGPARPDDPRRYAPLRRRLATKPDAGTNLVISSHGNPFRSVAGLPYLAEGEMAVVRPLGGDTFTIVARLRITDWESLPDR